jgi:hypothetical protein
VDRAAYLVEQQGARKILDTSFMAVFMFDTDTDPADVAKYFAALKRAQMELDLTPEPYKRYNVREIPPRFRHLIDVRAFGPGEHCRPDPTDATQRRRGNPAPLSIQERQRRGDSGNDRPRTDPPRRSRVPPSDLVPRPSVRSASSTRWTPKRRRYPRTLGDERSVVDRAAGGSRCRIGRSQSNESASA